MENKNSVKQDFSQHMLALEQFPLNRSLNNFRYHKNPILERGKPGEWDDALIRDPMIFYDNSAPSDEKFKLYYCGASADSEGQMQIGLAYGSSLKNLTKYPRNPIVTMTEPWENAKADPKVDGDDMPPLNHTPYVFQMPGSHSYEMLYTARERQKDGKYYFSTGRVTSTDGKNWGGKKQVLRKFNVGGRTYSPTKPIPIYNAEEGKYFLVFSASLLHEYCSKNEGFVALATSMNGEEYVFDRIIVPQDKAYSIFDPHGLVTMLGWYFLLITHDGDAAFDADGNDSYPERWMVSRDLRTWYGGLKSVWDTYPDDGILYSHLTPLLTGGAAYMVYDYGEPNVFGLAQIPLIGRPWNTIVKKKLLDSGRATELAESYPAISLEPGQPLVLTMECTYEKSASSDATVRVYTSYDGEHWDTEEQKDAAGKAVFGPLPCSSGQTVRQTGTIPLVGRFVKVTVKNNDLNCSLKDVKVVVTL